MWWCRLQGKTPSIKQKDFEHLITGLAHAGEADRAVAYLHQLAANAQSSSEAAADATASLPDDVLKNRKPIDPDTFTAVIRALTRYTRHTRRTTHTTRAR